MWLYIPKRFLSTSSASAPESKASASASSSRSAIESGLPLLWRSKPLPLQSWSRVLKTVPWTRLLSSLTSSPSTLERGAARFRSSLPDIPASLSAAPAAALARRILGTYGRLSVVRSLESDPQSSFWRTYPATFRWAWPSLFASLNDWATESRRQLLARKKSARLTDESASSSWPSATASDYTGSRRSTARTPDWTSNPGTTLTDAIQKSWPTPSGMGATDKTGKEGAGGEFAELACRWPTPMSRDGDPKRGLTEPDSEAWRRKVEAGAVNAAGLLSDDLSSSAAGWPTPTAGVHGQSGASESRPRANLEPVAEKWGTPRVTTNGMTGAARADDRSRIEDQAAAWPTPKSRDWRSAEGAAGPMRDNPDLNVKACLFGPPDPTTPKPGPASSPSGPTSPQPSLIAATTTPSPRSLKSPDGSLTPNTPARSQACALMRVDESTSGTDVTRWETSFASRLSMPNASDGKAGSWSTPRASCNIQNKRNLPPPSEGGRSSKPGLEDQIQGSWATPALHDAKGVPYQRDGKDPEGFARPTLLGAAEMWPTPRSAENGNDSGSRQREEQGPNPGLKDRARSWPTPQAHDSGEGKTPEQIEAMRVRTGAGVRNLNEEALRYAVPTPTEWQTPTGSMMPSRRQVGADHREALMPAQAAQFPTPTVPGEHSVGEIGEWGGSKNPMRGGPRKRLNPLFVEYLVGLPPGWTDCAPLETSAWRRWLARHSWSCFQRMLRTTSLRPIDAEVAPDLGLW